MLGVGQGKRTRSTLFVLKVRAYGSKKNADFSSRQVMAMASEFRQQYYNSESKEPVAQRGREVIMRAGAESLLHWEVEVLILVVRLVAHWGVHIIINKFWMRWGSIISNSVIYYVVMFFFYFFYCISRKSQDRVVN